MGRIRAILFLSLFCSGYTALSMCQVLKDYQVGKTILRIQIGSITKLPVTAIVNAANAQLAAGGGVCGAIYWAAGQDDLEDIVSAEKKRLGITGIAVGEAFLSGVPHGPPSKLHPSIDYIVHAVGPDCRVSAQMAKRKTLLQNAYSNSLKLAASHSIRSIAFPFISSAIFACPMPDVAEIPLRTVVDYVRAHSEQFDLIIFVFMSEGPSTDFYIKELDRLLAVKGAMPAKVAKGTGQSDNTQVVGSLNTLQRALEQLGDALS